MKLNEKNCSFNELKQYCFQLVDPQKSTILIKIKRRHKITRKNAIKTNWNVQTDRIFPNVFSMSERIFRGQRSFDHHLMRDDHTSFYDKTRCVHISRLNCLFELKIVWQRKTHGIPFECNSSTRPTVGRSLEIECAVGSNELSQNINKREPNTQEKRWSWKRTNEKS